MHAPGQPAPPPELGNHARAGALVVVRPQVAYAARDTYTFSDICRIGEALEKGELDERDLDERCLLFRNATYACSAYVGILDTPERE